jgi:hypothetical protein
MTITLAGPTPGCRNNRVDLPTAYVKFDRSSIANHLRKIDCQLCQVRQKLASQRLLFFNLDNLCNLLI